MFINFMEKFVIFNQKAIYSVLIALAGYIAFLLKRRTNGPICDKKADMSGKIILVTGGNKGIGKAVVKELSKMGGRLIIASRDKKSALATISEINNTHPNLTIEYMYIDLSKTESIILFASNFKQKYQNLHILINNAGIISYDRELNNKNQESTIATNYLGHYLLTYLLLDLLRKSAPSKIINVSSNYHLGAEYNFDDFNFEKSWNSKYAYKVSKLYQVMMTKQLHKYYHKDRIYSYSLSPGFVRSNIFWNRPWFSKIWICVLYPYLYIFAKDCFYGAQTILYLAVENDRNLVSGEYYRDLKVFPSSKLALSDENNTKLWEKTKEILNLN